PVGLCIVVSIVIGMVIGYLHGWFITRLDVPPFAITLVTLTAAAGGALALTSGQPISGVAFAYQDLTLSKVAGIPVPDIIFVAVAVIGGVSLYGGEGRIVGMVFGILLLMLINNALIVLNVNPYYQQVALGLV